MASKQCNIAITMNFRVQSKPDHCDVLTQYRYSATTNMHDALLRTEPHAKSTIRLKQLEPWLIRQSHLLPVLHSINRNTLMESSASMSHESERTLNWPATYVPGIFRIEPPHELPVGRRRNPPPHMSTHLRKMQRTPPTPLRNFTDRTAWRMCKQLTPAECAGTAKVNEGRCRCWMWFEPVSFVCYDK